MISAGESDAALVECCTEACAKMTFGKYSTSFIAWAVLRGIISIARNISLKKIECHSSLEEQIRDDVADVVLVPHLYRGVKTSA